MVLGTAERTRPPLALLDQIRLELVEVVRYLAAVVSFCIYHAESSRIL